MGCFSWCSQRFELFLRKLQIRKALGNERVAGAHYTPAWHGATECSLRGWPCLASQYSWNQDRDGLLSPSCSQKGDSAGSGWSLEGEVGKEARSLWEPHIYSTLGRHVVRLYPEESQQQIKINSSLPAPASPHIAHPFPGPLRYLAPISLAQGPRRELTGCCLCQV